MSRSTLIPAKNGSLALADVVRSTRVTPNMIRVTVAGEQLAGFEPMGFDQWFRLFLPRAGETDYRLPKRIDLIGYAQYLAMPRATRPHLRNYTVRNFRPAALELDIDFVAHGDGGVASAWAAGDNVGDRVGILDQGIGFSPQPDADWMLLVADESGLPAVAGILRDLPRSARGHAIIEIPHADDAQETGAPQGVTVQWVVREDHHARPGALALATAQRTELDGSPYVYVAGESRLATGLRRWAVTECGLPKHRVAFYGYWRMGHGR